MVRSAQKNYDSRQLEGRIAQFWSDEDIIQRTRTSRAGAKPWYFLDGPPYTSGHIHIGTARNKMLKDAYLRRMRMLGYDVRDQPGYDMHGLPIEVKVEKELGIETKKAIEEYGIDRFVESCRHFALSHLATMNEEFKELAIWMDWDKPYMTLKNEYIEGAWWAISRAHERGLLFHSERILTWCWRCETALANAEVEFEDRKDPSAYVTFPVEGKEREFFVIWTTTPWTLPANVAIAVHPDITYARVRVRKPGREEILIVAAEMAEAVAKAGRYEHFDILAQMKGTELEGMHYVHPFQNEVAYHRRPASEWNNRIILGNHVIADRTGLVHTATGHGVEDYDVGKQYGIPVFSPLGDNGRYTDEAGALAGLAAKTEEGSPADSRVLELLEERNLLLASKLEKHSYGHCWRCKNPLVFRATKQWFINVPELKDKMISEVKRVHWTPEWAGSARQLDWVQNARDWCISRQRYWGIPLPVWECTAHDCGNITVVSSRKELDRISNLQKDQDLHRPWIDSVRVVCDRPGCGGVMKRAPDVLDVWFDSAVASWASRGFPAHSNDVFEPAQWIIEGLDQTRGWFYSQLAAGVAALDRVPYERVVMHGWVHDAHGRPMSKSLGNIVKPTDVVSQFGVDAFRFSVIANCAPWEDLSFGEGPVKESLRSLNILWNVHVFATGYMADDKYEHDDVRNQLDHLQAEDRWLLSRLQTTIAEATAAWDKYEFHRGARVVENFVLEDLSRWYVRLIRDRVWEEADSADKNAAYAVLYESLHKVALLLAPYTPHLSEAIYQDLTEGKRQPSVHMEDWPSADAALTDYDLEYDMGVVRAATEAAAYARQKANMKLRWPVAKLVFASDKSDVRNAITRFKDVVCEQANAKDIEMVDGEWEHLDLEATPNKSHIGRNFRADGPKIIRALAALDQSSLRTMRGLITQKKTATLDADDVTVELSGDIVSFETRLPAHTSGADFPGGSVYVDTEVTPELEGEGAARDITRRIQEMRKQMGLAMNATIVTTVNAPDALAKLVAPHLSGVAENTRSPGLHLGALEASGEVVREWDLEGTTITIGVRRAKGDLGSFGVEVITTAKAATPPSAPATTASAEAAAKPASAKKATAKKAIAKKAATASGKPTKDATATAAKAGGATELPADKAVFINDARPYMMYVGKRDATKEGWTKTTSIPEGRQLKRTETGMYVLAKAAGAAPASKKATHKASNKASTKANKKTANKATKGR